GCVGGSALAALAGTSNQTAEITLAAAAPMRRDGTATRGLSQICLVIVMKLSNVVGCHRDSRLEGSALSTVLEWAGMPLNLAREKLKRQHMLCTRDTF